MNTTAHLRSVTALFASMALLVACGAAPESGEASEDVDSLEEAVGGSCKNACGGQAANAACYCDAACAQYGDCCTDYQQQCSGGGSCHTSPLGSATFCSASCPCTVGQGDCDSDAECQSGLVCRFDVGAQYGFPSNFDVCETPAADVPCGPVSCDATEICCDAKCGICGSAAAGCPDIWCEG